MRRALFATALLLIPTTLAVADAGKGAPPRIGGAKSVVIEADGHALRGAPWQEQARIQSLSFEFGLDAIPAPVFALPAEDHDFYLLEDERDGAGPKPLRFAVPVAANVSMEDGEWIPVPGGSLWRLEIASPNAVSANLSLTGIDLPEGQHIRVSVPGMMDSTIGPIEGVGEFGNGTAYGLCLPSNRTLIEWFVPTGARVKGLPFATVAYFHGYRDIFSGAFNNAGDGGVAGNCHNQPSCFATWLNESNGTVRLIFNGFLCSGQLTATTAADETPYVSTANHCISSTADANACQFNFFYRTPTCNAAVSAGVNVLGSDLSSTYLASDCTLLLVRPTLPTNVFWIGWTNQNPGTNTASTGLHHPGGAPQAISFGVKNANAFNCGAPQTNWASLSWNNGITEGGSSGSAIYRDSDKRMYGVLTCGASSCQNTAADDGYGRWDIAVNTGGFSGLLAAGSDDAQEPNDTCLTARPVTAGTAYTNMVVKRLDEDWYALPLGIGSTMSMNMTFTHANGDVEVQLFSACGGTAVLTRAADTNNEVFSFTNTTTSSTIYMRVYLGTDTRNNYNFTYTVTTPPPDNDDCGFATAVTVGTYAFNTNGATNSALAIAASCTDGAGATLNKDVWFRLVTECNGTATVSTCGLAAFDTRLVVYANGVACPTAASTVIACNDDAAGCAALTSTVTFPCTDVGQYYLRIGSKSVVGGSGSITFTCTPSAPPCPSDIDGNGSVDGGDLAALLSSWGACAGCASDIDGNGSVDGGDLAALLGAWGACP
ncbi:MAG: hypothetical protein RIT24_865 [Planctomycetota bacterium]